MTERFRCRFKNQPDLQKHTEVHNEGTVYHCTVEGCDYSCQTFSTMSYHFKRAHQVQWFQPPSGTNRVTCLDHLCYPQRFQLNSNLWWFFQVGGAPKYKCHICDKVFSWCYTLTLHLRKKHELKWPSGHSRFRFVAAECRPSHHDYWTVHIKARTVPKETSLLHLLSQIQEGRRRLPESEHGSFRDCGGDEGDHEEHGQETAEPSEKSPKQHPEQERSRHPRERPKLSRGLVLALLQLLLLRLLRRVLSAQPRRRWVSHLLRHEHHPSHGGGARGVDAGRLWGRSHVWGGPGVNGGGAGSGHGCFLTPPTRLCTTYLL